MSESLAVRYRPRRFADVAGQEHVIAVLRSAARRPHPPQQILLAGPSGLGKTTTARIFAAALLCEDRRPDGDACGLCSSCVQITGPRGGHPDVVELDAASNGGKDEIRDLATRAQLAPLVGAWKVFIVDEAHGLTSPGGQAFLRLLEEPPPRTVFVLATTDPGKLPVALQGRCLYLEVMPPTRAQTLANLHRIAVGEDWDLPASVAEAVLDASDPALGMRGTVMTLDKLAGALTDGQPLSGQELEQLLGVVDPAVLGALTGAIDAGELRAAVRQTLELSDRVGPLLLRRQLLAWAQGRLSQALERGQGVEQALARFTTFVEAPSYDGALTVAVARVTRPSLAGDVEGVRTLLERAQDLLDKLHTASAAPAAAATAAPAATPAPPAPDQRTAGLPDVASPSAVAAQIGQPGEPAPVPAEPLANNDPRVLRLLNGVGHLNGSAAFVLRRCTFTSDEAGLHVHVPADAAGKARVADLAGALAQVPTDLPVDVAWD